MTVTAPPLSDLYSDVIGQDRAVSVLRAAARRPVHAYLFIGPPGTGKRAAAISFAASLLCPTHGEHPEPTPGPAPAPSRGEGPPAPSRGEGPPAPAPAATIDDVCRRVLAGLHPDVVVVEREGASIGIGSAREVTRTAYLSPVEGPRKVVILHDFHLVRETGPALLKTIEEPPPSTIFVILADYLPPELVTIASRCVQVEFMPLAPASVVDALIEGGIDPERAAHLAEAAGGRLDRARLLAADNEFEMRRLAWHNIPTRLDGTGSTAATVAGELVALLDSSVAPLKARHAREIEELTERNARAAEVGGSRGGKGRARATKAALNAGLNDLEERHKREIRRQRTDELRAGLATLSSAYRERMAAAPDTRRRADAVEGIRQLDLTAKSLAYNPGELLALQALFARLGRLPSS